MTESKENEMTRQPLKKLMTGLIYPAVLGSALVLGLYRILDGDPFGSSQQAFTTLFGAQMFVYFCIGYLSIEYLDDEIYSWPLFLLDFLECIIISCVFIALGFESLSFNQGFEPMKGLQIFYLLSALLVAVQQAWLIKAEAHEKMYWVAVGAIFIASAIGAFAGNAESVWNHAVAFVIYVALTGIVGVMILDHVKVIRVGWLREK